MHVPVAQLPLTPVGVHRCWQVRTPPLLMHTRLGAQSFVVTHVAPTARTPTGSHSVVEAVAPAASTTHPPGAGLQLVGLVKSQRIPQT